MKIPSKIKLQGKEIKIEQVSSVTDARLGHCNGKTMLDYGLILLEKNINEDHKARVLMEEIIHILLDEFGWNDESSNEKLVQTLASGLYTTIKENNLQFN